MERPKILSVNISARTGERKTPVARGILKEQFGLEKDAHAGSGRQVSLLAVESINKMRRRGLDVNPGDFAENLTTEGMDLLALPIGTVLHVGDGIVLRVTQIGKECHDRCNIYYLAGDCVMPREGIFAEVLAGGPIAPGDIIEVEKNR